MQSLSYYVSIILLKVKPSVSDEPPTTSELRACARCIEGDISFLAATLNISDEKMESIRSRFKNPQSQALQMLTQWQSEKGGGRQELAGILNDCGFPDATKRYVILKLCIDLLGHKIPSTSVRYTWTTS